MPTRNVNMTDHFDKFITKEIKAGRYRNASEVMRAGLSLLEKQKLEEEQKLKLLRALAEEGFRELDQGLGIEIQDDHELAELIHQIGRRAATKTRIRSRKA